MTRWRDASELLREVESERISEFGLSAFFGVPQRRQASEEDRIEAKRQREREKRAKARKRMRA